VPGSVGLQEVDPDEHAVGQRGQGQLYDHPLLPYPRELEHQDEVGRGDGSGKKLFMKANLFCKDEKMTLFKTTVQLFQADVELRETILKIWPYAVKDKIELIVPTTKGTVPAA
jgi:hypothetical protein